MMIEKPKKRKVVIGLEIDDIESTHGDKALSLAYWDKWIAENIAPGTQYRVTRLLIRESLT